MASEPIVFTYGGDGQLRSWNVGMFRCYTKLPAMLHQTPSVYTRVEFDVTHRFITAPELEGPDISQDN